MQTAIPMWCWISCVSLSGSRKSMTLSCSMKMRRASTGDTGARCKLLFDRLACPHFKAAFDFANFVQCEQDTAECWELLHDQIVYIHIKDALPGYLLNVPAGTGLGKIPELLRRAFCEESYHGFLTLEPHLASLISLHRAKAERARSSNLRITRSSRR